MYKFDTQPKVPMTVAALALTLALSAPALAGKPDGKIAPGKPGDKTIVEIALDTNAGELGEFDYLLGAVGCFTDEDGNNPIVDLLNGSDTYTLFAPVDSAFEALQGALGITEPSPELTCAVDDIFGAGTLFTVLAYHVTDGRRVSNSVFNQNSTKEIEMLDGGYIWTMPGFLIEDGAGQEVNLVSPLFNLNASNGVIHVIDTVMLPFNPF
jgi:transforming growth factor-beta-induced protein